MARGLLRKPELQATLDSCVLGETFQQVKAVPELAETLIGQKGSLHVVCVFDQVA